MLRQLRKLTPPASALTHRYECEHPGDQPAVKEVDGGRPKRKRPDSSPNMRNGRHSFRFTQLDADLEADSKGRAARLE